MKKFYLIILVVLYGVFSYAQPVKYPEAEKFAVEYMKNLTSEKKESYNISSVFTEKQNDNNTLYIINFEDGGFVIMAAN
ncbi:MAG: Spi family protease inhibitor, partial [Bacteroidales bacterium]